MGSGGANRRLSRPIEELLFDSIARRRELKLVVRMSDMRAEVMKLERLHPDLAVPLRFRLLAPGDEVLRLFARFAGLRYRRTTKRKQALLRATFDAECGWVDENTAMWPRGRIAVYDEAGFGAGDGSLFAWALEDAGVPGHERARKAWSVFFLTLLCECVSHFSAASQLGSVCTLVAQGRDGRDLVLVDSAP